MEQIQANTAAAARTQFHPDEPICPICRSQSLVRFNARASDSANGASISVVECNDCTFAWQFPLGRSVDQSARYFAEAYQNGAAERGTYFDAEIKSQIAKLEIDFVSSLPIEGKRMLDVGAGSGLFARAADSAGWQVTAVDPAIDPQCLTDTNVRVIRGNLDELNDDETFDVITLWDVIEHLDDPMLAINAITRRLKRGGWLVIETGNYKSVDRVLGASEHWIYQLDHRWYFAPDSVQHVLTQVHLSEFTFADRALRPGWQGRSISGGPTTLRLIRDVMRRPLQALAAIRHHVKLQRASEWQLSGLPIFCVAARRP